jgi:hypothetical protein
MPVPLFTDFGNKKIWVGVMTMIGPVTAKLQVTLPEAPKRLLLNLNHDVLTDREEVKRLK